MDIKIIEMSLLKAPLTDLSVYYKCFSDCGSYIDSKKVIWEYNGMDWVLKSPIKQEEEQLLKEQIYIECSFEDRFAFMSTNFLGEDKKI